jgi:hypothetical protein
VSPCSVGKASEFQTSRHKITAEGKHFEQSFVQVRVRGLIRYKQTALSIWISLLTDSNSKIAQAYLYQAMSPEL